MMNKTKGNTMMLQAPDYHGNLQIWQVGQSVRLQTAEGVLPEGIIGTIEEILPTDIDSRPLMVSFEMEHLQIPLPKFMIYIMLDQGEIDPPTIYHALTAPFLTTAFIPLK